MTISINNKIFQTPTAQMTVAEMLVWQSIPANGTAVAVNDRLVPRSKWSESNLNEGDAITVISVAFGG